LSIVVSGSRELQTVTWGLGFEEPVVREGESENRTANRSLAAA